MSMCLCCLKKLLAGNRYVCVKWYPSQLADECISEGSMTVSGGAGNGIRVAFAVETEKYPCIHDDNVDKMRQ